MLSQGEGPRTIQEIDFEVYVARRLGANVNGQLVVSHHAAEESKKEGKEGGFCGNQASSLSGTRRHLGFVFSVPGSADFVYLALNLSSFGFWYGYGSMVGVVGRGGIRGGSSLHG